MTDNFEKIEEILKFDELGDHYYFLQIIQRKKDDKNLSNPNGNNNSRSVRSYFIDNIDYYKGIKQEVINLCEVFDARAMINLHPKSYITSFKELRSKLCELDKNDKFRLAHKSYTSVAGSKYSNVPGNSFWIVDIDQDELEFLNEIKSFITEECDPKGKNKLILELPSKSGVHLITGRFNREIFKKNYPTVDIKTNSPTNLYIP